MRSSISSSDDRFPQGHPWKRWGVALLGALAMLALMEGYFRFRGYQPSLPHDDRVLWARIRAQASEPGCKALVCLGDSRVHMGIVPSALARNCPGYTPCNLAVAGKTGAAVLKDLAQDASFKGVVLYGLHVPDFQSEKDWGDQKAYVDYYHDQWGILEGISLNVRTPFQASFAVLSQSVALRRKMMPWLYGVTSLPQFALFGPDRFGETHFHKLSAAQLEGYRKSTTAGAIDDLKARLAQVTPEEWQRVLKGVASLVARIKERGGNVVFVRMPLGRELKEAAERLFPKEQYWNVIAPLTRAATLDFEDMPECAGMLCPDNSHVEPQDAVKFTEALTARLKQRGILDGAARFEAAGFGAGETR